MLRCALTCATGESCRKDLPLDSKFEANDLLFIENQSWNGKLKRKLPENFFNRFQHALRGVKHA